MSTNENGEEVIVEDPELDTPEGGESEGKPTVDWEAKAKELEGRLKRAETKLSKTPKPEAGKPSTSNGLDYGMKAFLVASGLKGESEMKFFQQELEKSGKTPEELLENKYFKADIQEMRELAKTEDANPKGKRTGTTAIDSVEYWLGKPFEEVPKEMRAKVVNAKQKASEGNGVFYNS